MLDRHVISLEQERGIRDGMTPGAGDVSERKIRGDSSPYLLSVWALPPLGTDRFGIGVGSHED